jgi:hypothetical protein
MSYKKAMRWNKKHPKGTKQPVIMHTNSGFWPSGAFLKQYAAYVAQCKKDHISALGCEAYYNQQIQ